jgi:single stranded DNA-binding protein
MADINNVVLSGRLTNDPELHYINKGNNSEKVAVCRFTVATEDPFGKKSYIPIIIWRNYAEAVANYLIKGQEATVTGKVQSRQDKEKKRTFIELHASEVKYGPKPTQSEL